LHNVILRPNKKEPTFKVKTLGIDSEQ